MTWWVARQSSTSPAGIETNFSKKGKCYWAPLKATPWCWLLVAFRFEFNNGLSLPFPFCTSPFFPRGFPSEVETGGMALSLGWESWAIFFNGFQNKPRLTSEKHSHQIHFKFILWYILNLKRKTVNKDAAEVMADPEGRWFAFNMKLTDYVILEKKGLPTHLESSLENTEIAVTVESLINDLQDLGEAI